MKIFWNWIVVMFAQSYKYIKNHTVVPLKWLSCVMCELYLKKAVVIQKAKSTAFTSGKSVAWAQR